MLIGFTGKKYAGKSTAASVLVDAGFNSMSFASTLKKMVRVMLHDAGLTSEQIAHAMDNKEAIIPVIGKSYRWCCQALGTDYGRQLINDELWILTTRNAIVNLHGEDAVFDDVRFDNEANLIRELGGVIIHVVNPHLVSIDEHVSEAGIGGHGDDLWLYNHGSKDDLINEVIRLLDVVRLRVGNVN